MSSWDAYQTARTLLEHCQESSSQICSCSQLTPNQMGDRASQLPWECLGSDRKEIQEQPLR